MACATGDAFQILALMSWLRLPVEALTATTLASLALAARPLLA